MLACLVVGVLGGCDPKRDWTSVGEIKDYAFVQEKEGVTVSEEEMKQEIYGFAMRYNVSPENIIKYYTSKDGSIEGLRNAIFDRKTMKVLLEKAKKEKE